MHPNGQLPAYEWALGDVNPPVHAWAAWRVYKIEKKRRGVGDRQFLERVFQKLLLNFTWWVNRKDAVGQQRLRGRLPWPGQHRRVRPLPAAADRRHAAAVGCDQLDGDVLAEPAGDGDGAGARQPRVRRPRQQVLGALRLHRPRDGLSGQEQGPRPLGRPGRVLLRPPAIRRRDALPVEGAFDGRADSALRGGDARARDARSAPGLQAAPRVVRRASPRPHRPRRVHADARRRGTPAAAPSSPQSGCSASCTTCSTRRSSSRRTASAHCRGTTRTGRICWASTATSIGWTTSRASRRRDSLAATPTGGGRFGFRSNFLLIESLQKFHHYFGDDVKVECPTGSGRMLTLAEVATELSRRLSCLFLRDRDGRRPVFGDVERFQQDPNWRDLVPFHEYFHGDTGRGVGASHQTGWTGLVAKLLQQSGGLIGCGGCHSTRPRLQTQGHEGTKARRGSRRHEGHEVRRERRRRHANGAVIRVAFISSPSRPAAALPRVARVPQHPGIPSIP